MNKKDQIKYLLGIINAKSQIKLKISPIKVEEIGDIKKGILKTKMYENLFEEIKIKAKLKEKQDIPIIIMTKIIESVKLVDEKDVDGFLIEDKNIRDTALLYTPAILCSNGELKPAKNNALPWMPIEVLAPFGEYVSVGEWKESNICIETKKMLWNDYWNLSVEIYESTTKKSWTGQYIDDIERRGRRYPFRPYAYVIYDDTVVSKQHIKELYQSLIEFYPGKKISAPLLDKMLSAPLPIEVPPNHPFDENNIECMKRHLGVMSWEWTLSPSQRESLHHLKELKEGNVLAISGPPGTGKTTLLQSVVADLIVDHAINKKKAPIIVATSTNNKAVVNIIDSFSDVSEGNKDKLGIRWTSLQSLAAFYPSSSQYNKEEFKKYFKTTRKGEDSYATLEEKMKDMAKEFINNYNLYFGNINIDEMSFWKKAQQKILAEIEYRKNLMLDIINAIEEVEFFKKKYNIQKNHWLNKLLCFFGLERVWPVFYKKQLENAYCLLEEKFEKLHPLGFDYKERLKHITHNMHPSYKIPETDDVRKVGLSELNGILDITLRYQMFWLAVHYYEARWLSGENKISQDDYNKTTYKIQNMRFYRMAMLCPCMVMTFYMLPGVFELFSKYNKNFPYFSNIDLLIVDEAGQVSPEVAIPSFALAKRSVIVGDARQIPPVWSVSEEVDYEMARKYDVFSNEEDFKKSILNCSSSSLMKVACSVCDFQAKDGKGERGLFLCEHRRCYEEIIKFCNELIYQNRLHPVRPDVFEKDKAKKLGMDCPAMGHIHVSHIKSESKDGSRFCVQEAEAIAKWLADNLQFIKAAYTKKGKFDIKKTISIITPFKTQTDQVKKALKKYPALSEVPYGTVHTFQGAESKIVIFSTVYGKNEKWQFIKNNKNLINVAVSRTKDYFFTFGERSISDEKIDSKNAAQLLLYYTREEIPELLGKQKQISSGVVNNDNKENLFV